jgi:uncharacterized protein YkwD
MNDMNPHALLSEPTFRLVLACAVGVVLSVGPATGTAYAATDKSAPSQAEASVSVSAPAGSNAAGWRRDILARVNAVRSGAGLAPLRPCLSLQRAAQIQALHMAETNSVRHEGPGGSTPWDRMRAQGFSLQAAAENLASGQTSIEDVMREWVESPLHNQNLLDPNMRQVGFGFAVEPTTGTRTYWVQDFGRGTGC